MPDLTGNSAIDTAIGLAFAYFLLSLVVSSLTEAVSSVLQLRWKTLRRGIRELLLKEGEKSKQVLETLDKVNTALTALDRGDLNKAKKIAEDLQLAVPASLLPGQLRETLEGVYPHVTKFENSGRIKALWKQTGFLARLPLIGNRGPSYIEPRTFALTLLETLGITDDAPVNTAAGAQAGSTRAPWAKPEPDGLVVNAAEAVVSGVANPVLDKWLRDAITEAKGERDKLLASLESSFDAMTNRISGWYKRYATIWIVLISAAVALALNADSYAMASRLWKDDAVRSALVAQADKLVDPATCDVPTSPTEASSPAEEAKTPIQRASDCVAAVKALGLPLGWAEENRPDSGLGWFAKFGGIVITVFALMLGAPFWFDTLNKLARLRATGKPEGTGTKSE